MAATADEVAAGLAAPFDPAEVKWKPQSVSGSRALVIAFIDARLVQDRLDDVLGVMNWQDNYECLPDGSVVCRLKIRIGDDWITKEDVGGMSEQPDEGDRRKAAFSDALKRAAVKFGIGRYLYRLKAQWMDYDPQKRQLVGTPRLPPDAMPRPRPEAKPAPAEKARPGKKEQASALLLKPLAERADACKTLEEVRACAADGQALRGTLTEADLAAFGDRLRLAKARIQQQAEREQDARDEAAERDAIQAEPSRSGG